jgi:hypothetical protein
MLQCYYVKVWSVSIWNRWNDWLFRFWRTFIFSDSSVLIEKFQNYNHIYIHSSYIVCIFFVKEQLFDLRYWSNFSSLIRVCWMGYKWCWFIVDFWLVVEWLCSWFFVDQLRFKHIIFLSSFMNDSPTKTKANDCETTSPLEYVLFLAWMLRQRTLLAYFYLTY